MQTFVNKRLESTQDQYKRDCDSKIRSITTFKSDQILYIDKPPIAASSAGNAESLATTSFNTLTRPIAVVSVQSNTLTIDKQDIQNKVSIGRATLAPDNKTPINASQRFSVEGDPPMDLDTSRKITPIALNPYAVDQTVSNERSGGCLCYQVCLCVYLPMHITLKPAETSVTLATTLYTSLLEGIPRQR